MKNIKLTLGDICYIEKGKIGIQAAIPGDYPLVTTGAERSSHNEYHFNGEAVCIPLVSATGHGHASIKRIHFQKGKFCVGNILCACMPKDYKKTSAKFLHLYFSLLKDVILVPLMQGSANVSLKIKDLERVEVPDVSFERQLEIVDEFERLEVINARVLTELHQQQTYLQLLRQTILQEAVQGKLTNQNPKDEPATELLKRIKAEKEKLIKAGKLKKEKELPTITEDEIPFEIPEGWVWCRIEDISTVKVGSTPSRQNAAYWKGSIPWVASGEVANNYISETKEKITEKALKETSVNLYPINTVLIAMIGQGKTRGQTSILNIPATTNQNVAGCIIDHTLIVPEYLWNYFLSSYEGNRESARGGNQPALNGQIIKRMLFPLPPLAEQKRIVAKVQQLQQQLSQVEAQVQQSRQYAQQLLQSVLKEAFEKKGKVYEMMEVELYMVAEE